MIDYVVIGIVNEERIESTRYNIDANFKKNSHYAHERLFGKQEQKWRYRCGNNVVYWYDSPSDERKEKVSRHLNKVYGVKVPKHLVIPDFHLNPECWTIRHDIAHGGKL